MKEETHTEILRNIRKDIDPDGNYPLMPKPIRKWSPRVYALYFGKRYVVPNYRADHYFKQEFMNYIEWAGVALYPYSSLKDDVLKTQFACNALAMRYNRPQLFLERELGEAQIESDLPLDMMAEDIKWRWPAMRIFLPKGLLEIERGDCKYSMMFMDIALVEGKVFNVIPAEFAPELDLFLAKEYKEFTPQCKFKEFKFGYQETCICVAGMIEKGTRSEDGLTTYGLVKPFAHYTLRYLQEINKELSTEYKRDNLDDLFLKKMEVLALQVLLYLSAYPLEYKPETVIRKPRMEGKHHVSGLYAARFVGQSQIRPERSPHAVAHMVTHEEYHLRSHWRRGHWKRQPFGPKWADRKLVWIHPYQAGREEEEAAAST